MRCVSYPNNRGRGKALRTGFKAATGRIVVSIDADLSYDPRYIHDLVKPLRTDPDVDFVLASPYMPGGGVQDVPFLRLWISKLGNKILRFTMPNRIYTSTGIFRAYHRKVLDSIELESDGKEIHLEILSKAIALGYRVKEIPAILTSRKKGKSKFKFKKTALSHLVFSFFEKPMMIFGFLGLLTLCTGCLMGIYVAYLRFAGLLTPGRPLITFALLLIRHGSENSWADGPVLSQQQVRALTNSWYPYVYSFACVTGSYHLTECFGETWLRTTNGGSIFYGSSVNFTGMKMIFLKEG